MPYAWWRAGPWAGKSALLSSFVLRPPPEVAGRVRIVSFFITARLAAQGTRDAFTAVLAGQLAELTGQVLPAVLPEATREGFLLDLLAQAAASCQQAGGRLVLVVDGLDEDRGVTTGLDAHSIAALLPASPPAGWRAGGLARTPEYLLSGYYALLADLGDLPRMIACATDAARHDRMLGVTGGDAAALAEARAALDLIAAQGRGARSRGAGRRSPGW